ncbi:phosphate regulon sensor histidine kinase PhoR [Saccharospirillum sp. HFRX-1]|uniref:phosphate regulon sensor histidine kinase PhoR n=1 Tax=unclassified Saccharospirillum TaxID=2633430 RepID=UPI003717CF7E
MIRDIRRPYYRNLLLFFAAVATVGFLLGYPLRALLVASLGCLLWQLFQQGRLIQWLRNGARSEPPDAGGLWGMVFDHFYSVQRDHRQQVRHLQNVISRIQTSTQALRDGVIQLDRQGALEWWNPAAEALLSLKPQDQGQLLTNLLRDPTFVRFYNKGEMSETVQLENPAFPDRYIDVSMTIYGKGERLLLIRDTTRIKQLEQMRQDFVANASHELKTPLTVLKGYLESILTFGGDLPPALSKGLTNMEAQTQRMDNLVNDLLVLTRLDAEVQHSVRQSVNVGELLEKIAADARELSNDRGHRISVQLDSDAALQGDASELHSAISNLVYNAVNYSPDGSDIELKWKASAAGGFIAVHDQGIGIDPRHIPRLTERFYRVDPGRSSARGGTGLGLAIVKHILQHHQARLDIASVPGRGSVFTCCFPAERVLAAAERSDKTA